MIYFLFLLVLSIALFDYNIQRKDMLSPTLWACAVFLFSIFINILNVDRWGASYSWHATFYVIISLIMLMFGELFVKRIKNFSLLGLDIEPKDKYNDYSPIIVDNMAMIVIVFISIICLIVDLRIMSRITGSNNVFSALLDARHALSSGEERRGFIGRVVLAVNKSLAYIFIYIILRNKVLCNYKNKTSYIVPVAIFCIDGILSTGRTLFIRVIAYSFIVFVIFSMLKNGTKSKHIGRIVLVALGAMFLLVLVFTYLGKLFGKGIYDSATDVFYYYSGSSIYLFNQYIVSGGKPNSEFFGEHTLYGVYNLLHYIFPSIEHNNNPALEMSYIPHWYSNVYTAFRRYYQDYGIAGLIIMPFILGVFYGNLEVNAYSRKDSDWKIIFFAFSIYPIIEMSIEERFLVNYLSFSTAFELTLLYLLFRFVNVSTLKISKNDGISI